MLCFSQSLSFQDFINFLMVWNRIGLPGPFFQSVPIQESNISRYPRRYQIFILTNLTEISLIFRERGQNKRQPGRSGKVKGNLFVHEVKEPANIIVFFLTNFHIPMNHMTGSLIGLLIRALSGSGGRIIMIVREFMA